MLFIRDSKKINIPTEKLKVEDKKRHPNQSSNQNKFTKTILISENRFQGKLFTREAKMVYFILCIFYHNKNFLPESLPKIQR